MVRKSLVSPDFPAPCTLEPFCRSFMGLYLWHLSNPSDDVQLNQYMPMRQLRRFWPYDYKHCPRFHSRGLLYLPYVSKVVGESLQHFAPKVGVHHLAPFESNRCFNFPAVLQKFAGMPRLKLKVVIPRPYRIEFYLLKDNFGLFLLRFFCPFALLILKFPVIHNLAYGRISVGGNFNQIKTLFSSNLQRLARQHRAELLVIRINNENLPGSDSLIHSILWFPWLPSPTVASFLNFIHPQRYAINKSSMNHEKTARCLADSNFPLRDLLQNYGLDDCRVQ